MTLKKPFRYRCLFWHPSEFKIYDILVKKVDSDDSVYHIRQRSLRIPDILASDVDAVVANYRKYGNIQTFEHKESAVVLTFATKEEAEVASKADNRAKLLHYGVRVFLVALFAFNVRAFVCRQRQCPH